MMYYKKNRIRRTFIEDLARCIKMEMGLDDVIHNFSELVNTIHEIHGSVNFIRNNISYPHHEIEKSRVRACNAMGVDCDKNDRFAIDCVIYVTNKNECITSDQQIIEDIVRQIAFAWCDLARSDGEDLFFVNQYNHNECVADIFYKEFMLPEDLFRQACERILEDGKPITNKHLKKLSDIFNVHRHCYLISRGEELGIFDII